ncbi:MAG: pilus assembly protein TadG-related protein [Candidatus Velthaea sp.]
MANRTIRHSERGQALPLLALAFVVLMGFTGLAVDVGYERYQQRAQQSATDSAAIAGASELIYSQSGSLAAARKESASNGFTHDGAATIVSVNNPPQSGTYSGNTRAIEVIIDATRPTFFEQVLGKSTQTIETRSTALLAPPTRRPCIYALSPSPSGIRLNAPNLNAPNCGIISNGDYRSNSGTVGVGEIGVVGSITANSTTFLEATPRASIAVADPCALTSGCAYLKANPPATAPCDHTSLGYNAQTVTLYPGIYCGGTRFNASNVALSPGVYVFDGGLTSSATALTGNGVTLILTTGALTANAGSYDLTAPSSGNTQGVVYYQPAGNTSGITLNGNSGTRNVQGEVYAPTAALTTNASFGSWTLIVASDITLNSGTMNVPATSTFPGGIQSAVLTQ